MKLASLESGCEGRLFVVSDDMGWCVSAAEIAPTLQAALADWAHCAPLLKGVATYLNTGAQRYRRFEPSGSASPLAQSPDLSKSRGDLEAQDGVVDVRRSAAVLVGALNQGAGRAEAVAAIRLVLLQAASGAGVAESPVAVTPDSLGEAWREGRLSGQPTLELDGHLVAGAPLALDFAAAIVEAARSGPLADGAKISLSETKATRLSAVNDGAVLRYELRDSLSRSTFGAVELRAKVAATVKELA
ncbi:MAG TPA: hypothetical protein VGI79_17040 [Caulobacteraceae bacterium]|jgi:fumarylacetoacetate (FAA) hydrolase